MIGRASIPRASRCAESGRGCAVMIGMMGEGGETVSVPFGVAERYGGSERRERGILCRWGRRRARKYVVRSSSVAASCRMDGVTAELHRKRGEGHTAEADPSSSISNAQFAAMTFA